tara:strand:+ start:40184 stop:40405 length:222 start_codon:yes stop_codon:yes gene_type:complete
MSTFDILWAAAGFLFLGVGVWKGWRSLDDLVVKRPTWHAFLFNGLWWGAAVLGLLMLVLHFLDDPMPYYVPVQ